ncbi:MAG: phenylacetate-CoA oxygenase subunit PaaI [Cellvibrionaceae bacterium]|nr:phenylacetate-CoA oxygenase subunit PaaI [Cellvibrionaceae bacterium]
MPYTTEMISPKYHQALINWQKKYFPDISLLEKYWDKHFKGEEKYRLCSKITKNKNSHIVQGKYAGHKKFNKAGEMKGSMLYQALRIIKAQCSTELGSIQQHADTVDASYSDFSRFSILRIMAEEFRHAYQMFWVLSHDPSWATTGHKKIIDHIMDELLSMKTGSHVLDAFNIPFMDALDNIVFAAFIDRVGKFQLSMQEEFSYSPMAASMKPMLHEEAFHLKTGWLVLKEICENSALENNHWSIDDIQKKINLWYPRAIEMFGNVEGGESNRQFSFKTHSNKEAKNSYVNEVKWLLGGLNTAIHQALNPSLSRSELRDAVSDRPYLYLPSENFLRIRSKSYADNIYYDSKGNILNYENYLLHIKSVLPENFFETVFYKNYEKGLKIASI